MSVSGLSPSSSSSSSSPSSSRTGGTSSASAPALTSSTPASTSRIPVVAASEDGADVQLGGEDVGAVVVDLGGAYTRVGYAQEDAPRQVVASVAGRRLVPPLSLSDAPRVSSTTASCGSDVSSTAFDLRCPISFYQRVPSLQVLPAFNSDGCDSLQVDGDVLAALMLKTIEGGAFQTQRERREFISVASTSSSSFPTTLSSGGLGVLCSEHPILLSEPNKKSSSSSSRSFRQVCAEICFDFLDAPALFFARQAVLNAFAVGRTNALVVDVGAIGTSLAVVTDGHCLQRSQLQFPIGGDLLENHLQAALAASGQIVEPLWTTPERRRRRAALAVAGLRADCEGRDAEEREEVIAGVHPSFLHYSRQESLRQFKIAVCEVQGKTEEGTFTAPPHDDDASYELPDGTRVLSAPYRYSVGELFFDPSGILGVPKDVVGSFEGIHKAITSCVAATDVDLRRSILGAIVLTGGSSLMPGFSSRLVSELQLSSRQNGLLSRFRVVSAPSGLERQFSCWVGGSILASLGTFQHMWVSRSTWQEEGVRAFDKYCY
eukprot:GHVT01070388.1.p1 GENE.GHVT01070388.1~~GHVT01070388.1.p1  ORF type:complete len:546 (+),score=94.30 GHVT01070388.1:1322-2959(+)